MSHEEGPVLVSACLLGIACRHDGKDARRSAVIRACAGREILPVCPEVLAGMGTPRDPVFFAEGDGEDAIRTGQGVVDDLGRDRTAQLLHGARQALEIAESAGARTALLKERSPSCGVHVVHRGQERVPGRGVFAALLAERGVELLSDEEVT